MAQPAIRVEGLWKQYALGGAEGYQGTLYDLLTEKLQSAFRRSADRKGPTSPRDFWALRDVSFEVQQGEVIGVVGRNGAGKSTLLKVLSRITAPTRGRIEIKGRLASLLEVGTGFHPELSGRENIYLNGAILGMSRREVTRKFDEIVAFAEIDTFIDTPVKRYSSGMYVRLAFAIAAHLEPDVLVVDEVLAVGDAQFQRKCLGKLGEIRKDGRTIFFVSHNPGAVKALCTSALLLKDGAILLKGGVTETLVEYMRESEAVAAVPLTERSDRAGSGALRLVSYWMETALGARVTQIREGEAVRFCFSYIATSDQADVFVAFDLRDPTGDTMVNCNSRDYSDAKVTVARGAGTFVCEIPFFALRAGRYVGNVFASSNAGILDWVQSAVTVVVVENELVAHERYAREARIVMQNGWRVVAAPKLPAQLEANLDALR